MLRRRIIRTLFIALPLLLITAWLWSYFYQGTLGHNAGPSRCILWAGSGGGSLKFYFARRQDASAHAWWFEYWKYSRDDTSENTSAPHLAGFRYEQGHYPDPSSPWYLLTIPFWFPVLLSLTLLYLIWKKTRPASSNRAFPVQPKSPPNPKS